MPSGESAASPQPQLRAAGLRVPRADPQVPVEAARSPVADPDKPLSALLASAVRSLGNDELPIVDGLGVTLPVQQPSPGARSVLPRAVNQAEHRNSRARWQGPHSVEDVSGRETVQSHLHVD